MSFAMITWNQSAEICYMYKDSLILYIKTERFYSDIAKDVETRFDTSNYELGRPLHKQKIKNNWINERWIKWENRFWCQVPISI